MKIGIVIYSNSTIKIPSTFRVNFIKTVYVFLPMFCKLFIKFEILILSIKQYCVISSYPIVCNCFKSR